MSRRSVRIYGGHDNQGNPPGEHTAAVSKNGNLNVQLGDSASIDAFDRLRVSNPTTIFDSVLKYDKQDTLWYEALTGTATSTHEFDEASVKMTVAADGDKVVRQTKEFFRYQPGKSQLVLATWVMDTPDPNVRRRVGYFETENGIFLEEINGALWIVLRSSVTGSVVDTRIAQSDWNLDAYPELDTTKTQILVIDLQWLGVGRVRVGFVIDGIITYVHQFLNSNVQNKVYMTTAQLPVHVEIEATGAVSGAFDFWAICSTVMSEGGIDPLTGIPHSVNSGTPTAVSGTMVPILSIRPKATYAGEINRIATIQRALQVINTGNGTAEVHVIYDGVLTGASFASVEADSVFEVDVAATTVTGGHHIQMFYVPSSNQASAAAEAIITGKLPMSVDIAGANPINLTIAVTNHGTVTAAGSMTWQEYQ